MTVQYLHCYFSINPFLMQQAFVCTENEIWGVITRCSCERKHIPLKGMYYRKHYSFLNGMN